MSIFRNLLISKKPQNPKYTLSADGYQYIDTGVTISGTEYVPFKIVQKVKTMPPDHVFRYEGKQSVPALWFGTPQSENQRYFAKFGHITENYFGTFDADWHIVALELTEDRRGQLLIDHSAFANLTLSQWDGADGTYYLYQRVGGAVGRGLRQEKEWVQIYQNNELVRDFVPVPKYSTQYSPVPAPSNCLYDKITGTYFENIGTGSFIINEVKTDEYI